MTLELSIRWALIAGPPSSDLTGPVKQARLCVGRALRHLHRTHKRQGRRPRLPLQEFTCIDCGHFRSDTSYLPELKSYLRHLLGSGTDQGEAIDVVRNARQTASLPTPRIRARSGTS